MREIIAIVLIALFTGCDADTEPGVLNRPAIVVAIDTGTRGAVIIKTGDGYYHSYGAQYSYFGRAVIQRLLLFSFYFFIIRE